MVSADSAFTIDSATVYQWGRITVTGSTYYTGAHLTLKFTKTAEVIATTTVGDDGTFKLTGLNKWTHDAWYHPDGFGPYFTVSDDDGYIYETLTGKLEAVGAVLTLAGPTSDPMADEAFTLTGTLTDTNGALLPTDDVIVGIYDETSGLLGAHIGTVTTFSEPDGAFSCAVAGGLHAGDYILVALVGNPTLRLTLFPGVTTTVHSTPPTEEHVIGQVRALNDQLNSPDSLHFQTQKQEDVFVNKLNGLIEVIDAGDINNYGYAEALAKIANDLTKYNNKWGVSGDTIVPDALATITAQLEELQGIPG